MPTLYYGDHLGVMREHLKDASVDRSERKVPRMQILTIEELLDGRVRAEHPDQRPDVNFKKAKRETGKKGQEKLF